MSVLSHLTTTASNLLTKGPSAADIDTSLETLKTRLESYFSADALREYFTFGSWKRDTNLPRSADQYADVDFMVVFKGDYDSKPQTLLDRLKRFVEMKYSTSDVKQSHPTVVLALNHIQFELVPAIRLGNTSTGTLHIPAASSSYSDWQSTYPYLADAAINDHNKSNSFLSKPLVRLLKYWNCQADPYARPFSSFEIEQFVASKFFYLQNNLKDYFFGAVDALPVRWDLAQSKKDRINRLKQVVNEVRKLEADAMPYSAEIELKKVLPEFS